MPIKIIRLLSGQFGRPTNAFDKKMQNPLNMKMVRVSYIELTKGYLSGYIIKNLWYVKRL